MKSSLIRSIAIFAAGAATAALASDPESYPDLTVGEWEEQAMVALADVARLGAYVVVAADGRVGIMKNPHDAACISPKPPVPNGPPDPPVGGSMRDVRSGTEGILNFYLGLRFHQKDTVYLVDLCHPVNERGG